MGKTILCPRCGKKVMTYDERGTMPLKSRCSKCEKLVTYFPTTNETKLGLLPVQDKSGGKRFY